MLEGIDGIRCLVLSVETGSFAAAARKLGVTPSAVSRRVALLERELGVALLARTTRSLRLTHDGQAFHDRCVRALAELDEARDAIAHAKKRPSGLLRVETATNLGRTIVGPSLPRFLDRHPDVQVHLTLRDQLVDPVVEGVDVLVRIGPLASSSLIARKLGETRLLRCASPGYLRKHGTPRTPADLASHRCLGWLDAGRPRPFTFSGEHGTYTQEIAGPCHVNDADVLAQLAASGRGIVTLFDFLARGWLERGELVTVLDEHGNASWPIHALYPPNRHLLPKVRVFLDHLARVFREISPAGVLAGGGRAAHADGRALRRRADVSTLTPRSPTDHSRRR
ncbi:LysR family transcriptional regulator [Sandaracinus amylolyticus]|uniref:LysR family transcriptional regulator n=1 Tax=Sandaracinus amylolyticus TaxID=927083 RepID=UPI001F364BCC|nr:LysR family transcriptional regulator [Sandaracinus amylolyticus]